MDFRLQPPQQVMNFRVQRLESGGDSAVFSVSGRVQAEHTEMLTELLEQEVRRVALDLEEVILVDLAVVRFLAVCERRGVELRNCPAYVREWVRLEMAEGQQHEFS